MYGTFAWGLHWDALRGCPSHAESCGPSHPRRLVPSAPVAGPSAPVVSLQQRPERERERARQVQRSKKITLRSSKKREMMMMMMMTIDMIGYGYVWVHNSQMVCILGVSSCMLEMGTLQAALPEGPVAHCLTLRGSPNASQP